MIYIGSYAIKHHIPSFRNYNDIDVMLTMTDEPNDYDKIIVSEEIYDLLEHQDNIATLDAVYTIKCSHFHIDNKWEKTKQDILFLQSRGCKIIPELYKKLKHYWNEINPPKFNLSLNKSKKDFFTDKVTYIYDHDYIHELVAYPHEPMYKGLLVDGQEVLIDKKKFDKLQMVDQLKLFREEITAIAIERWLVNPYWKGQIAWPVAYRLALKKTIISLTKNWAQDFIIQNLNSLNRLSKIYFIHAINKLGIIEMNGKELINEIMVATGFDDEHEAMEMVAKDYFWGDKKDIAKSFGYKQIAQEGGGEGGAEYCYTIFEWKGKTYKIEYSYRSHEGNDYYGAIDTLREVKPVEKTVTVYE